MFKKILVCSDGSDYARDAALVTVQVAAHFKAEVVALNVFPTFLAAMGVWNLAMGQDVMDDYAKAQKENVTKHIVPLFAHEGVQCRVVQELGHPVSGIVRVAEREKADLIVVGNRGVGGPKEVFLGSVSNGILHHAPCPVLIVR